MQQSSEKRSKVFIIAELSANHGQRIEVAVETIKAAKRAGADAIKLQTYTAETLTMDSNNAYFTIQEGLWKGRKLFELYQEAHIPWEWHATLFNAAKEQGIQCFSSPFDKTAVDFLEQFNPPAYKIASFEIQDIPLIRYTAEKMRPMILSTGIAELRDIDLAVRTCRKAGNEDITLLKCTSTYPASLEEANLATLPNLAETFGVKVGLSDHSLGIVAPVVATTHGAQIIEKHFILDKSIGGPDASFSLDEEEFSQMVTAVRQAEKSMGTVNYELSDAVKANRKFARSLFAVQDIPGGEIFTEANIRSIRPGYGLHPKHLPNLLGRKANKDILKGSPLTWDIIE